MSRFKPRNDHGGGRVAIRLQDVGQRLSFIILISAAVVLLLAGRADSERMESLRTTLGDFTAPVLEFSSLPIQGLRAYFDEIDQYFNTVEENRVLRAKIERLQMWQQFAVKLESENKEFRSLLNAQEIPPSPFVSARVIGDLGSPFVHTVLVNTGVNQGIEKGMPVIGAEGLIGQVVSAGKQVSRVLLLSDMNSRIPVRLEASGYQAVLGGDNEVHPQLLYLPPRAKALVGDRLVTSGHGGFFPPGIPVGKIDSLNNGPSKNEVRVQTFSDEHRLTFVRILQYHGQDSPPGTIGVNPAPAPAATNKEGAPVLPATPIATAGGR
ncbi:MAG: rod shape-determining protein MreC [Alphaproteobacteria bacterium]|nr:rod shape-determining protein MreC [Alphaproteobacteria bacterium]